MSNPLFQMLTSHTGSEKSANNALPPLFGMMQEFLKFKNSFKGNAREQVEELLKSGKMSQSQFDQLKQMAEGFKGLV